ncbi:MAG: hypothetical protein FD146_2159 [Anaerolineaceae bacterium]|nr:MAG: hypothetical protein FD146_2159 [Anaerolineaceae bacterium]
MAKGKKEKLTQVQRQRRRYQAVIIIISALVLFSMILSAVAKY